MKIQNIIASILVLSGILLLWFFTAYALLSLPVFIGMTIGATILFTLIIWLIFVITSLKDKVTIFLVIGLVWFATSIVQSYDLYKMGKEHQNKENKSELKKTLNPQHVLNLKSNDLDIACKKNDMTACYNLGVMYMNGAGIKQDLSKVKVLFAQSCKSGNPSGCYNLGVIYANGIGSMQDFYKAEVLYEEACNKGLLIACDNLGLMVTPSITSPTKY